MTSDGTVSDAHAFLIVIVVVVIVAAVASIGIGIWKSAVRQRGGLNPIVAREQLEAKLNQHLQAAPPAAAVPDRSKAERLAEVMDLHERGLISDVELATARAKIIGG